MSDSGWFGEASILGWTFAALLLLLAVISTLAARGTLRRNHVVGIRLPPLYASEEAWRRGHAAAVRPSWIGFVIAIVADIVGIIEPVIYWVAIAAFVVTVTLALVAAIRAAVAIHGD